MKPKRRNAVRVSKLRDSDGVTPPCPKCGATVGGCVRITTSGITLNLKNNHRERGRPS